MIIIAAGVHHIDARNAVTSAVKIISVPTKALTQVNVQNGAHPVKKKHLDKKLRLIQSFTLI